MNAEAGGGLQLLQADVAVHRLVDIEEVVLAVALVLKLDHLHPSNVLFISIPTEEVYKRSE